MNKFKNSNIGLLINEKPCKEYSIKELQKFANDIGLKLKKKTKNDICKELKLHLTKNKKLEFCPIVKQKNTNNISKFTKILEKAPLQHMTRLNFELQKILRVIDPAKNESRFVYGKVAENALIDRINEIKNARCYSLDKRCLHDSQKVYDCEWDKTLFSIKVSKDSGNYPILINYNSSKKENKKTNSKSFLNLSYVKKRYNLDQVNYILCCLDVQKLYIFPAKIIPDEFYRPNQANLSLGKPKTLYKMIEDRYPEFVYKFPSLQQNQERKINNLEPFDIYQDIWEDIKNDTTLKTQLKNCKNELKKVKRIRNIRSL